VILNVREKRRQYEHKDEQFLEEREKSFHLTPAPIPDRRPRGGILHQTHE
jgi:hypothetical protein